MWVEIFRRYIAVFLVGNVIKWLDDDIDGNICEASIQSYVFTNTSNGGKLSYSLLAISIAMLLDTSYSFSLFTSSYIIGMFHYPKQKLSFGLKTYQEIIVVLLLNLILIQYKIFFHSFTLILIIQLMDDIIDREFDYRFSYFNYVNEFGIGEVIISLTILFIIAISLSLINTMIIIPTAVFINYLYSSI